ncbi:MAG: TIGR03619 family F420-dependent LLM class oxidoreductase [Rhodospirillaceae bacterium]|nr:TIGR03619 family F420-dependent LLM class oxidoreductase [Rhodospirillaceae bacterium]
MKIGYFGFNMGPLGVPEAIREILGAVERCGFESAWTGEHVIAIDPQVPPSPIAPDHPMLDTVAALSFAAAATSRIKLGSGIILLAQRNPLVLAKELASIDVLSQGRLLVGVGVGYIAGEFEALGIPYGERGGRVDDHIEAMRAIWTQEKPVFKGKFTSFAGVQSKPSPVQRRIRRSLSAACRHLLIAGLFVTAPAGTALTRIWRLLRRLSPAFDQQRRKMSARRTWDSYRFPLRPVAPLIKTASSVTKTLGSNG